MIVKSKARRTDSFKQLINYILHDKGREKDVNSFILTKNLKGDDKDGWIRQFEKNEQNRLRSGKNASKVLHEILSFHSADRSQITKQKLIQITEEYLRLRSENGMFLAVPHMSEAHIHIHICGSPIDYLTGKSLRMTRQEFQKLKIDIQKFQYSRFPELTNSLVDHAPSEGRKREPSNFERDKQFVVRILKNVPPDHWSTFEYCFENGLVPYERGGKIVGIEYKGRKYRLVTLGVSLTELGIESQLELDNIPIHGLGFDLR